MASKKQMVINYVPGEECRVAIVEGGRLEEFHAERMDGPSSHVGNIYVGKVINVEPAIQAAFVDFGLEQNGFLHISDVHPQYFPGEDGESTERVGKKTPRRDRPPIQECFRRGDEVAVQVLKEGVGTKGPTVTSYLSIPGRFLVMMPQMDRVGVSRKVEDEEQRRKMREILDQLDLPDGFGFILRTAGMERTKAELKRDLAYLQRLWKDMEKRWRSGTKPRLLYSESDLLVRALRDMLTSDIEEVVVDNESALNRGARFLKIVAPRTTTRIVHFTGKAPVFHVLGIEPQIQMIHAREVPLESGGRLVIDEAEALVAIDVNSGRSRDARDAETNAFRTNMEACDEICRQLRLRDIGGVIVNDLIDMRSAKHRREVETRFRENLKKDRARWTIASISEFGILEMTRQRMRGSHESQHFADCPTCRGRGLVQRPDSVAADGLRELAALLDAQRVHRVEIVVHPRIAGELLSHQRRALSRLERTSGKHVDVRVSDAIAVDRLTFYAYDDRGADIELASIATAEPRTEEFRQYAIEHDAAENWAEEPEVVEAPEPEPVEPEPEFDLHPIEMEPEEAPADGAGQDGQHEGGDSGEQAGGRRRRRRGRRGGRGRGGHAQGTGQHPGSHGDAPTGREQSDEPGAESYSEHADHTGAGGDHQGDGQSHGDGHAGPDQGTGDGRRRRRRRGRRGGRGRNRDGHGAPAPSGSSEGEYPHESSGETYSGDTGAQEYEPQAGASSEDSPHYDHQTAQGSDGGPSEHGGPPSEGEGGRRGRRRRRGRRGRGGRGGANGASFAPGSAPIDGSMNGHLAHDAGHADGAYDGPSEHGDEAPNAHGGEYAPSHDHGEMSGEHDRGSEREGSSEAPHGSEGEHGGRRRRRRGRRGRGGRGQGSQGGSSGMSGGHHGNEQGRPPQHRGGHGGGAPQRSEPARDSRPAPSGGGQPPASKPGGPPKPRTLYSSRRRLGPGDLKGMKREE